jgi:hypothetical protein
MMVIDGAVAGSKFQADEIDEHRDPQHPQLYTLLDAMPHALMENEGTVAVLLSDANRGL